MRLGNNKLAYTLAELMIVILVLSIIFAAFAPIITKRRTASNRSKYAVWNWVEEDATTGPRNAYYEPGDSSKTGTALFGITPESEAEVNNLEPNSRVIIRSLANTTDGKVQRQMQFRYGTNSESSFAGSVLLDTKNILLGGVYDNVKNNTDSSYLARNNVALGYYALDAIKSGSNTSSAKNNTAVGYYAGNAVSDGDENNTYIGYQAGKTGTGLKGRTFVGSNAGSSNTGNNNTAIGYNAGASGSGSNNTFIGANVGQKLTTGEKNYGQGYNALSSLETGSNNIAIGANALSSLTSGSHNVAIGYNACSQVTTGSYKTCIGANSGPKSNSTAAYLGGITDNIERTYIGSAPKGDIFGGDAVLEIHNAGGNNDRLANYPAIRSNTTTVINGNLIVRGKLFMTSGSSLYRLSNNINPGCSSLDNGLGIWGDHTAAYKCTDDQKSFNWSSSAGCPSLVEKTTSSDRRLKNIGFKNKDGLNKIKQLKVYSYNFKNDKTKTPQVGVIAQELQKIFPNAVTKDSDGYLRIRWDEMLFASVNAIKELDLRVTTLIKKATSIETKIAKLEKQNEQLKFEVAQLTNRIEALRKK